LNASGVDLTNGGGFEEFRLFQKQFSDYKFNVFDGLNPNSVMFSGKSFSVKKLHLIFDRENKHYIIITNLKGLMTKRYICNGCDKL